MLSASVKSTYVPFNNNMGYIETAIQDIKERDGLMFNNNMGYIETIHNPNTTTCLLEFNNNMGYIETVLSGVDLVVDKV